MPEPISPSRLRQLAFEIADDSCISLIECYGINVCDRIGRRLWYEVDTNDECDGPRLRQALIYLDARGLLHHRPGHPNHVKILWGTVPCQ